MIYDLQLMKLVEDGLGARKNETTLRYREVRGGLDGVASLTLAGWCWARLHGRCWLPARAALRYNLRPYDQSI